ncbi:unnamed protein product, partial [Mesorhabditis spiculigera]
MRSLAALIVLVGVAAAAQNLPEKYYGKFAAENSKNVNFDEYLTAKGYGWFTRKLVTMANFEKVFKKSDKPNAFSFENLTSKKNVYYTDVTIGQKFKGEGLDGTQHEVVFELVGDHLFEKHTPLEEGEAKAETHEYFFEEDWLVVQMKEKDIVAKRYYKRQ